MFKKLFNTRRRRWAWVLLVLAIGAGTGWYLLIPDPAATGPPAEVILERMAELSELVTLRIEVEEVLTTRVDGYAGGIQATILARGDVVLAVDLSEARLIEIDDDARTGVLLLPLPRPFNPRLDHQRTRVLSVERHGLWLVAPTLHPERAVIQAALQAAQQAVEKAAATSESDQRARRQAEQVLQPFCTSLGWTIQVRWSSGQ